MNTPLVSALELIASPAGHKQLKEEVAAMHGSIKQTMDTGLSNEDMNKARALETAVRAADDAIDELYAQTTR